MVALRKKISLNWVLNIRRREEADVDLEIAGRLAGLAALVPHAPFAGAYVGSGPG